VRRAALIGCGRIGSEFADDPRVAGVYTHAGAFAASAVEFAAVCDVDAARAARCARRWGVAQAFTDVDAMLEQVRPAVVSVCTPDETHAAILRRVLASADVRAILAEKPLAQTTQDADALVRTARERGVVLAVNYSRRYSAGHARVREMIAAGRIGTVQAVSGFYTKGVLHNGTHWFDLARWLVGEIAAVQAFTPSSGVADPTLDVRVEFDNGAAGFLHGCAADAFAIFEMDVVGTEGRVRLVDAGHTVQIQAVGDSPHYSGYRALLPAQLHGGGFDDVLLHAVADLLDCLDGRAARPRCSAADGLAALRVAEAAMASAGHGRRVELAAAVAG
jgi:predicted dehydrogenase